MSVRVRVRQEISSEREIKRPCAHCCGQTTESRLPCSVIRFLKTRLQAQVERCWNACMRAAQWSTLLHKLGKICVYRCSCYVITAGVHIFLLKESLKLMPCTHKALTIIYPKYKTPNDAHTLHCPQNTHTNSVLTLSKNWAPISASGVVLMIKAHEDLIWGT